ncbi:MULTISPECIES: LysR family transcriptional regulator [Pseudomonas]|uniref:LysR family transcriptional regulator n=1 Tax=Pseudomonas taiwanensis TaxID=470150 RepID=A0A7L9GAX5_9PSED|nr:MULTISPECIES: LysR family transcriptional regulator [Pseudomonas]QOJ89535.1 LysR family transcriptional regulator [Pseudomonas taiwanensis]WQQ35104.1 LysR family transcriptional regulator [Pseudomonas putida]
MDISKLGALRELSVRKTMAAVAEAMHISPSAVSQQISLLEQEFGIDLVERRGRGVELTIAGRTLVERINRIFEELDSARADMAELKKVVAGELRVSAFPTVAAALIPKAIQTLRVTHPRLQIFFEEMEPEDSMNALRSWQTDIALIDDLNVPVGLLDPSIEITPFIEDVYNILISSAHRLAGRSSVSWKDLEHENWVIDTASTTYPRMITEACQRAGYNPKIIARCKGFEITRELVKEGCAIAILPGLRARADMQGTYICRLEPEIRRNISMAFRKGEKKSPILKVFKECLEQEVVKIRVSSDE